jgi:MYXO-CTERM domain-containing protein
MKKTLSLAAIAALAIGGSAIGSVRVFHASPDAPNVDVFVNTFPGNGDPAISNLAFESISPYVPLATGLYDFRVTPAGLVEPIVINAEGVAIDGDTDYTIAAGGFLADIQPFIFVDDNTIDAENARVRFIHLSPDAPAVDVNVAGLSDPLFDATVFGTSGGYQTVGAGSYDVSVSLDSDGTQVLGPLTLDLSAGTVYTIFATGSAAAGTLNAVVVVDAIPAPGALALLGLAGMAGRRRRRND